MEQQTLAVEPTSSPSVTWRKALLVALLIGGLIAFVALGGTEWLSLDTLRENRSALLAYTERNYALMLGVTVLVYVVATALSLPGATVLSLATGLLFGRWIGTAVIAVGATIGATLVFLAARYLFADAARRRMGPAAQRIVEGFRKDAFNYLLFLRLVPLFPFWLINLVPAFTPIRTQTYVLATAIGILPGAFVFANLGESLGRISSAEELVSTETLLALGLLGVLALVPVVVKRLRRSEPAHPAAGGTARQ